MLGHGSGLVNTLKFENYRTGRQRQDRYTHPYISKRKHLRKIFIMIKTEIGRKEGSSQRSITCIYIYIYTHIRERPWIKLTQRKS